MKIHYFSRDHTKILPLLKTILCILENSENIVNRFKTNIDVYYNEYSFNIHIYEPINSGYYNNININTANEWKGYYYKENPNDIVPNTTIEISLKKPSDRLESTILNLNNPNFIEEFQNIIIKYLNVDNEN